MAILENLHDVLSRIEGAARRAGRDPADVTLVAVTKKAGAEAILELARSGRVKQLGENRVQDAAAKRRQLEGKLSGVAWRMIGHLQRNKARAALEVFDTVDSLDSLPLAQKLDGELSAAGRDMPVLVQVKLTGKETQSGVAPEAVPEFLARLRELPRLRVRGLMAIAPELEPVAAVRPYFRRLKELFDRSFPGKGGILSMGMSRDFEIAVEEGSNMVRVGSALFN